MGDVSFGAPRPLPGALKQVLSGKESIHAPPSDEDCDLLRYHFRFFGISGAPLPRVALSCRTGHGGEFVASLLRTRSSSSPLPRHGFGCVPEEDSSPPAGSIDATSALESRFLYHPSVP